MTEPTYFKACATCMYLTANGEYNDGEDTAERCIKGQQKIWGDNYRWFMLAGCDADCGNQHHDEHECESFEQGFSWSDCEGCGDTDGGDRYLLAVFEK